MFKVVTFAGQSCALVQKELTEISNILAVKNKTKNNMLKIDEKCP